MENSDGRRPAAVWSLIALHVLLGVGAVISGGLLIAAPDGHLMQMPLSMLEHGPFSDFLIPGLILFTLLGIYPLCIAYALWKRPGWRWPDAINPFKRTHWSWAGSLAAGVIVVVWIVVEVIILRSFVFLQILYLVWGTVLVLVTLLPVVRWYCTRY
ncbi:MAG: hypothetical protein JXM73_09000 [Anaerolineae bacterium]|nr:hypothetical protein [Anaerolineae bacterium]